MEKPVFYYVYIIQSKKTIDRFYTGFTENINNRLNVIAIAFSFGGIREYNITTIQAYFGCQRFGE